MVLLEGSKLRTLSLSRLTLRKCPPSKAVKGVMNRLKEADH